MPEPSTASRITTSCTPRPPFSWSEPLTLEQHIRAQPPRPQPVTSAAAPNKHPCIGWCGNAMGFSLHAGVHCEADGCQGIEQLARYITQRLAALVPRARLHLIRFHGVLAPDAKLRSKVVPARRAMAGHSHEGECKHAHGAPVHMTWARLLKRVFEAADFTRRAARVSRGNESGSKESARG